MITKDQAHTIADDLLDHQYQTQTEEKNLRARPVPLLYRCAELNALEPRQRMTVVVGAQKRVSRRWPIILALLAWSVVWSLIWIFSSAYKNLLLGGFIALGLAPQFIVPAYLIRREVRKIAKAMIANMPFK
ncbi:MAG TPA: hypothetical protein VFW00_06130 [Rhodocyclaceae bacterium]|nr:hypothetical protein [Rhodocyclaceae bacterium]